MKGLKKIALISAIAAASAGAQAELKALDDSAMGELTGQAGLTIDIETEYTIGEFAYTDGVAGAGGASILLQGISLGGGRFGGMVDNIRLNLDVAGAGETLHYGFSEITELAGILVTDYSNTDTTIGAIALNAAGLNNQKTYNDGDLVIHIDGTDHLKTGGGMQAFLDGEGLTVTEYATNLVAPGTFTGSLSLGGATGVDYDTVKAIVATAVDFNYSIDAIGLASSAYIPGSAVGALDTDGNHTTGSHEGVAGTTTLISDLSIQGFLGPVDIHIENNGNGFDGSGQLGAGTGDANSQIHWDTYVKVTDLDVYIDIAGVQINDLTIDNSRGDTTDWNGNQSFEFAHSLRTIYAVKDAVVSIGASGGGANTDHYVDGIAINTRFKGDMSIGALSFGDTGESIGEIYITDITSTTNWTISAH